MERTRTWSVAGEIREGMERLTATERKVALVLLANYPVAGLETLAALAAKASVSAPTVHRFVGKLGYKGYPEFQAALRMELEAQFQSPLTKRIDVPPAGRGEDARRIHGFAEAVVDNIQATVARLPASEMDTAAKLLGDPKRTIYLFGGRFTDALAQYVFFHLHAIRDDVQHIGGQPAFWLETLLNIGPRDVLVVFDVRRYQEDVNHLAEQAAERGATVILFTDRWMSPIARVAKHVFAANIEVPSKWDSAAAIMVLVEALIAKVNDDLWPRVRDRIERLEELRKSEVDRKARGSR